jgi:tetratricopeptide (TPR) repeat protein
MSFSFPRINITGILLVLSLILVSHFTYSQNTYKTESLYRQVEIYYYAGELLEAEKAIGEIELPSIDKSVSQLFLEGKVYFDLDNFDKAIETWELALKKISVFDMDKEFMLYECLSEVYDDRAMYSLLLEEDKDGSLKDLQKAKYYSDKLIEFSGLTYLSEIKTRNDYFIRRLKRFPDFGYKDFTKPESISKKDLSNLVDSSAAILNKDDLSDPLTVNPEAIELAKNRISDQLPDLLKARKLLRLLYSESAYRLSLYYDQLLYVDSTDFYTGRTAQNVYDELYQGNVALDQNAKLRYRLGDCESASNLYIALAREIGLEAYMIRVFTDEDMGWLGEHRAVAVFAEEKMYIVDMSLYRQADVYFEEFRVLNDLENFSYFIVGGNKKKQHMEASIDIFPENDVALVDLIEEELTAKNPEKARTLLRNFSSQSFHYDKYWIVKSDLALVDGDTLLAIKILNESRDFVRNSTKIYGKLGELYKNQSEFDKAIAYYEKASSIYSSKHSDYLFSIADILIKQGENEKALNLLKELAWSESAWDIGNANRRIGNIKFEEGNYLDAIYAYDRGISSLGNHEKNELVKQILGYVYIQEMVNSTIDIPLYLKNEVQIRNITKEVERVLSRDPASWYFNLVLTNIHLYNQDLDNEELHLSYLINSMRITRYVNHTLSMLEKREAIPLANAVFLETLQNGNVSAKVTADWIGGLEDKGMTECFEKTLAKAIEVFPEDKDIAFMYYDYLKDNEKWNSLIGLKNQIISYRPLDKELIEKALFIYSKEGALQEGLRFFENAISKSEEQKGLWFKLAYEAYKVKDSATLSYYFKELELRTDKDENATLLNNIGVEYLNRKQYDKAEEYYLRALEEDYEFNLSKRNLANLYNMQGEFELAEQHFIELIGFDNNTKDDVSNALNFFLNRSSLDKHIDRIYENIHRIKNNGILWYNVGNKLYKSHPKDAELACLNAVEIITDSVDLSDCYNLLGLIHQRRGNFYDAEGYYKLGIEFDKKNKYCRPNLIDLYLDKKYYKKAKLLIDDAYINQVVTDRLINFAFRYYRENDKLINGLKQLESYYEINSDDAEYFVKLAEQAYYNDAFLASNHYYQKYFERVPLAFQNGEFLLKLVSNYRNLKEFAIAEELLKNKILLLNPDNPEALKELVLIYSETRNYVGMREAYREIIAGVEDGNKSKAIVQFMKIGFENFPENPDLLLSDVEKFILLNGGKASYYEGVAVQLQANNLPEIALDWYNKVFEAEGEIDKSKLYADIASLYFDLKEYKESLNYYKRAFPDNNYDEIVHARIIQSYILTGELNKAFDLLNDYFVSEEYYSFYLKDIAIAFAEADRKTEFIERLTKALESSTNQDFIMNSIYVLVETASFDELIEISGLMKSSITNSYVESQLFTYLSYAFYKTGKDERAEELFKRIMEREANNYQCLENYIDMLLSNDALTKAEEIIKEKIKENPENTKLYDLLAKINYFQGDYIQTNVLFEFSENNYEWPYERQTSILSSLALRRDYGRYMNDVYSYSEIDMNNEIAAGIEANLAMSMHRYKKGLNRIQGIPKNSVWPILVEINLYSALDEYTKADSVLSEYQGMFKYSCTYNFAKGLINYWKEDYSEALNFFSKTPEYSDFYELSQYNICLIRKKQGEWIEAENVLAKLLDVSSGFRIEEKIFRIEYLIHKDELESARTILDKLEENHANLPEVNILKMILLKKQDPNNKEALMLEKRLRSQGYLDSRHLRRYFGFMPV